MCRPKIAIRSCIVSYPLRSEMLILYLNNRVCTFTWKQVYNIGIKSSITASVYQNILDILY